MNLHQTNKMHAAIHSRSTDQTGSRFQQERIADGFGVVGKLEGQRKWSRMHTRIVSQKMSQSQTDQTGSGPHTSMLQYSRRTDRLIYRSVDSGQHNAAWDSANPGRPCLTMSDPNFNRSLCLRSLRSLRKPANLQRVLWGDWTYRQKECQKGSKIRNSRFPS